MLGDIIYICNDKWLYGFQETISSENQYRHYGIDVGNDRVIHFMNYNGNMEFISKVVISTKEEFSRGKKINKCIRTSNKYNKKEIVERAYIKLNSNFNGYNFLDNNCEHFVRWCVSGVREEAAILSSIMGNKRKKDSSYGKYLDFDNYKIKYDEYINI